MKYTIEKANKFILENKHKVNQKHRHHYHLMPVIGWMNDPNGLIYFKNEYHAFYQYHPYDSKWGPMHWGHAVSKDLITWKDLGVALAPDLEHEDGLFSGGAVVNDNKLYLLYTAHLNEPVQLEEQSLAISEDGLTFKKYLNKPVLKVDMLPPNASTTDFRDPKPVIIDGEKFLFVGSKYNNKGQVLVYKTNDYKTYTYLNTIKHDLFGEVGECPDLIKLNDKFVLLLSPTNLKEEKNRFKNINSSIYAVGDFNTKTGEFIFDYVDEIDRGHSFYAPQTLINDKKEVIMIGWLDMWAKPYYTHMSGHLWQGAFALPRILSLDKKNKLIQTPIDMSKYFNHVNKESTTSKVFNLKLDVSTRKDTVIKFLATKDNYFELIIKPNKVELSTINTLLMPLDKRSVDFKTKDTVSIVLDKDVRSVEVFIKDVSQTISTRLYFNEETLKIEFNCKDMIKKYELKEKK